MNLFAQVLSISILRKKLQLECVYWHLFRIGNGKQKQVPNMLRCAKISVMNETCVDCFRMKIKQFFKSMEKNDHSMHLQLVP
jgi:hypothetical protein